MREWPGRLCASDSAEVNPSDVVDDLAVMATTRAACALFILLTALLAVNSLECPLQGAKVALCAMCSQSNAAVRWTVAAEFSFFSLKYSCKDQNHTTVFSEQDDTCFYSQPMKDNTEELRSGISNIGRRLWVGLECSFTAQYRIRSERRSKRLSQSCSIQTAEVCEDDAESCSIERVSEMTEEGDCSDYKCGKGYEGYLCNNVDECTAGSNTCDDNAECHDTDGSYWCQCLPGFQGDGYNCTDMDECLNVTCGENAECLNTEGTYSCKCKSGFAGDGYSNCTDINECLDTCFEENAECINTEGSFSCQCSPGFTRDGYNYTDVNGYVTKCATSVEVISNCWYKPAIIGGIVVVLLPSLFISGVILVMCRLYRTKQHAAQLGCVGSECEGCLEHAEKLPVNQGVSSAAPTILEEKIMLCKAQGNLQ